MTCRASSNVLGQQVRCCGMRYAELEATMTIKQRCWGHNVWDKIPHRICGVIGYTNWFKVSEYRAPGCCNPCSSSALACMWSSMSCNHNSICIFFRKWFKGKSTENPYIYIPMAEGPWCPVKLPLNQPIKHLCTMCIDCINCERRWPTHSWSMLIWILDTELLSALE